MTITDYRNFDLLIARAGNRYRASVVNAPAGEASILFDLPMAVDELIPLAGLALDRTLDLHGPGRQLFEAIFRGEVHTVLATSLDTVASENAGLRLRLRFEEDAADLANLPWEILYDPTQSCFLGLSEQSPILRYLPLPRSRSPLLIEPPLRMLVVLSSPTNLPALDLDREWQALQDALTGLVADGKLLLERLAVPGLTGLQDRLLGEPVHVLHFAGHGSFDKASQEGHLILENAQGKSHPVRGEQLAAILRNHPSLRLAYLNACEGALASGQSVFTGVAQTLVQGGVPAAIAMQAEITDRGAIELVRSFCTALATGRPVDAALTQARVTLSAAGSPEWALPILFSRSPDNRLFDIRDMLPTPDCPYPGMAPFTEAQKELFFGREREIEDAVERLRQHPFLAVVGPSGSGKSSLIQAGVIPKLRQSRRFGPGEWAVRIMRPGDSRTKEGQAAPTQALAQLLACPAGELDAQTFDRRTLLFVDQFEEIFTLAGAGEAQAFLEILHSLVGRPNLFILLTVRADFYPELMASSMWPPIRANRLELTPLGDDELWAAIVEPAARVGVTVAEALAVRLIADAAGESGVLPLVQETLVLLWDRVERRQLELDAYQQMAVDGRSGLQVAIDRRASLVYENLPAAAKPIARRIFMRLIQFGEGRADTRRQQAVEELQASGDDPALFEETLATLTGARLLTTSGQVQEEEGTESASAGRQVDIAHEALIAGWPRLQTWLGQRRAAEQTRRRLEEKAEEWQRLEKSGGLLDVYEVQEAESWLAGDHAADLGYSQDLLDLVAASKEALAQAEAEKEEQRQRELQLERERAEAERLRAEEGEKAAGDLRRRLVLAIAIGLIAVVAAVAAVLLGMDAGRSRNEAEMALATATVARGQAEVEAQNAEIALVTATAAQGQAEAAAQNASIALVTATVAQGQAESEAANARAAEATAEANAAIAKARRLEAERQATIARSRQLASASTSTLTKNEFEPAILLAIESGKVTNGVVTDTVEAFSAIRAAIAQPGRSTKVLFGHTDIVHQAMWSQDESKVLTVSDDRTVRIWDAASGAELVRLEGHTSPIKQATWSQYESKILTRSSDYTVRIWDAGSGAELARLEGHKLSINQATWSRDESQVLTAGTDGTARIWDADSGAELARLKGHLYSVEQALWSRDESKILTAGSEGTVRIWDASSGAELARLEGYMASVNQAAWSQDESKILTASGGFSGSQDNTARIWDAASSTELVRLKGHTQGVYQATWSQDESKVLTRSSDNTVRIWDAGSGTELVRLEGHTGFIYQATWSQDESKILTISGDFTTRIWDADSGAELVRLKGQTGSAHQATWSQDGSKILTLNSDHTVRIWDAGSGAELVRLEGHTADAIQATWSRDGSKILTAGSDSTARIWDVGSAAELVSLEGRTYFSNQSIWSQDESKILTTGDDGLAQVWDADSGAELVRLEGHTAGVRQATWSRDGSKILTTSGAIFGSHDNTVRIWDAASGAELVRLEGHTAWVYLAMWSQDEGRVLTTSDDHTARIWDAASGIELARLEGHTGGVYQAMWSQDDGQIFTASTDDTARIWDAASGAELVTLEGHAGDALQAMWSQDGSKILIVDDSIAQEETIRIWDTASGAELVGLEGHTAEVNQATWSQDGRKILTASRDGTARIWDADSGTELVSLEGHTGGVFQATWSRDGSQILTASADGTARIWAAANGAELVRLEGHTSGVFQATWSRDESKILTAGWDNTARIWDAGSGAELVRLEGHKELVYQATWSQDEDKILTASLDGSIRIWYTHMSDLIAAACKLTPRNFTWDEWNRHMEGDYRPTCAQAPIPPGVVEAIREQATAHVKADDLPAARVLLEQLNGWLVDSSQFNTYGLDVEAFLTEVQESLGPDTTPQ